MRETRAIIESVRRAGKQWQHLELVVDASLEQIRPGEAMLARTEGFWSSYLREVWIPVGFDDQNGVLIVERPLGQVYNPGEAVSLIAPVGSPYPLKPGIQNLLLVAQDYPPDRLLFLMLHALSQNISVGLVLTGQARHYPLGDIPAAVEVIHGDNENTWENMEASFKWADQIFARANPVFQQIYFRQLLETAGQVKQIVPENYLYGIYEFATPCGTGACMACMVRGRHRDRLACVEGPAFDLTEVRFD